MKFEFEHTWGGKDNWYTKSKRWAKKKSPFISHLLLGLIEWLYSKWIDAKIENTMRDVDAQTKQILEDWDEPKREPLIMERGVFGDEGWSIEITNPIVERGSSSTGTIVVPPSDVQRLQEDEGDQGTTSR